MAETADSRPSPCQVFAVEWETTGCEDVSTEGDAQQGSATGGAGYAVSVTVISCHHSAALLFSREGVEVWSY